jgi:hypothetical protein
MFIVRGPRRFQQNNGQQCDFFIVVGYNTEMPGKQWFTPGQTWSFAA